MRQYDQRINTDSNWSPAVRDNPVLQRMINPQSQNNSFKTRNYEKTKFKSEKHYKNNNNNNSNKSQSQGFNVNNINLKEIKDESIFDAQMSNQTPSFTTRHNEST